MTFRYSNICYSLFNMYAHVFMFSPKGTEYHTFVVVCFAHLRAEPVNLTKYAVKSKGSLLYRVICMFVGWLPLATIYVAMVIFLYSQVYKLCARYSLVFVNCFFFLFLHVFVFVLFCFFESTGI